VSRSAPYARAGEHPWIDPNHADLGVSKDVTVGIAFR
jgi:hypothetical protein